jgi:hypothetical protein
VKSAESRRRRKKKQRDKKKAAICREKKVRLIRGDYAEFLGLSAEEKKQVEDWINR